MGSAVEQWVVTKSIDRRGRRRKVPTLQQLVTSTEGLCALYADGITVEVEVELTERERHLAATLWWARGRPVGVDCWHPAHHFEHHRPHPDTARLVCWTCHPPAGATEPGEPPQSAPPPAERNPAGRPPPALCAAVARNEPLDTALRHAGHGRPVLPCDPQNKRPLVQHGFNDATTDPERIREWFSRRPAAMLAIPTGAVSGVVVLDVDGEEGAASLRELEREHAALPPTASVRTPSGGAHFYFKAPEIEIPCSVGKLGLGLDVRATGGYVIVPPSKRSDGREYEIDEEAPAAVMPGWLLGLVRGSANRGAVAPADEWLRIVDGLDEGERNQGLTRLVGHLLRRYVDVDLTAALLSLVNERCRPPLAPDEVEQILESIAARELRRRQRIGR